MNFLSGFEYEPTAAFEVDMVVAGRKRRSTSWDLLRLVGCVENAEWLVELQSIGTFGG